MPSLHDVHDAILMELLSPARVHHTVVQDIALNNRLLDIIQNGGADPDVVARLFHEAMDGV